MTKTDDEYRLSAALRQNVAERAPFANGESHAFGSGEDDDA